MQMCRNDVCRLDETSYDTDVTQLLLSIIEIRLLVIYINGISYTGIRQNLIKRDVTDSFRFFASTKQLNHAIDCVNEELYWMVQKNEKYRHS